jgi:hypothetical protein
MFFHPGFKMAVNCLKSRKISHPGTQKLISCAGIARQDMTKVERFIVISSLPTENNFPCRERFIFRLPKFWRFRRACLRQCSPKLLDLFVLSTKSLIELRCLSLFDFLELDRFQNVMDDWQHRLRRCIQLGGEYLL